MKKKVLIVGAGGFGRECLTWTRAIPETQRDWEVVGFLDDTIDPLKNFECESKVMGTIVDYQPKPNELLLLAIGDVKGRLKIADLLSRKGAKFFTLIHPSAIIGDRIQIGEGCVVCPNVVITTDVTIESFVILNIGCSIGHDAFIGQGSTLSPNVDVTGGVFLGKGVFVGTRASILPKVKVEEFAIVGAGSIVTKKVKSGQTVFGVPAREI